MLKAGVALEGCIYQCKDTNFKANHNWCKEYRGAKPVVFTNAKILILKLITTFNLYPFLGVRCIYQCKDTNFKANHNFLPCRLQRVRSCIYQCKDTNFKANHNLQLLHSLARGVVFTNAKILILKLITTLCIGWGYYDLLYLPMQRY